MDVPVSSPLDVVPLDLADELNRRIVDAARVIEAGFRGDAGPLGAYRRQLTWAARLLKVPLAAERLAALAAPARAILDAHRRGTLGTRGPDRIRLAAAECVARLLTRSGRSGGRHAVTDPVTPLRVTP